MEIMSPVLDPFETRALGNKNQPSGQLSKSPPPIFPLTLIEGNPFVALIAEKVKKGDTHTTES